MGLRGSRSRTDLQQQIRFCFCKKCETLREIDEDPLRVELIRAVGRCFFLAFLCCLAGGAWAQQQYIISTFAGGGPPPTPVPAVSTGVSPEGVATDSAGN